MFKIILLAFAGILYVSIAAKKDSYLAPGNVINSFKENKIEAPKVVPNKVSSATSTERYFLVTRVVDGDTVQIETGQKVRYIGVDTPETVQPNKAVQCFGKEAANKNKELVLNKKVRLVKDVSETDKYGRLLRYVYLSDEIFVNLQLVKDGYATAATFPPDVKFSKIFVEAEREARAMEKGLWGACN